MSSLQFDIFNPINFSGQRTDSLPDLYWHPVESGTRTLDLGQGTILEQTIESL